MKLSDLTVDDAVMLDAGFTCVKAGLHIVEGDDVGSTLSAITASTIWTGKKMRTAS